MKGEGIRRGEDMKKRIESRLYPDRCLPWIASLFDYAVMI